MMSDRITISKTLSVRDSGYDENWLQGRIAADPSILGLGDLVLVEREKRQLSGGKLDILLKTRDGNTVFEVETMLGETDGDHISRTIEYWDLEQRQDPKREHFPVLIAEEVTRRFFNLIHRFSLTIPIIAIKANIVEVARRKALHFTTILNAFDESKVEGRRQPESKKTSEADLQSWQKKSPVTVASAKSFLEVMRPVFPAAELRYFKFGLSIFVGKKCFFWFKTKNDEKTLFSFWVDDPRIEKAKMLFQQAGHLALVKNKYFRVLVDSKIIAANSKVFQQLALLVEEAWNNQKKDKEPASRK